MISTHSGSGVRMRIRMRLPTAGSFGKAFAASAVSTTTTLRFGLLSASVNVLPATSAVRIVSK